VESVNDAFALKSEFFILRAIQEFTIYPKPCDRRQNAYTNFEYKLLGYLETSNKIWCKHFSLVFAILMFKLNDLSGERTDWHLIDILAEYRDTLKGNH
jgi:hypothetical protein